MIAWRFYIEIVPSIGEEVQNLSLRIEVIDVDIAVEARCQHIQHQAVADPGFIGLRRERDARGVAAGLCQ